ncbi:4Fe-4S binding protein [Myxococcota bacterium]|nr:4Fe-4S binding protein [Myxococcota bacterium]
MTPTSIRATRPAAVRLGTVLALAGLVLLLAAALGRPFVSGASGLALTYLPLVAGALLLAVGPYLGRSGGLAHTGTLRDPFRSRGWPAWALAAALTGFYALVYWWPRHLDGLIRQLDPLALALARQPASEWFLYGFWYTLAVGVMGARMALRHRGNPYQQWRTASVVFFQLAFGFLIPQVLRAFQQPEFYFTYFWPLKKEYLFPSDLAGLVAGGGLGVFMAVWGVVAALVATPVLTWAYGKRWYCSWVCGCGGLAETAGDPFRHLSDKSRAAWRFERWSIHLTLVAVVGVTALVFGSHFAGGGWLGAASGTATRLYGFVVGAVLSGVVGVGFYPLLGSRVWCRYFCPQAAILGVIQRFFSRFRITTNGGQCISCGNCSTYCEMGIDVRAYAQRGENIVRASCVGCGLCAAVCPRGVLRLENGPVGDRFPARTTPGTLGP